MKDQADLLELMHEFYKLGNKSVIPAGLEYCMANNRLIPPWLATAFRAAYKQVEMSEVSSWDDVFGRPLKKGQRLATKRRNKRIAEPLFRAIRERHETGAAISKDLFAEVGAEFGVSGTVASDIYYEMIHALKAGGVELENRRQSTIR
jgi:hypothetical protein